MGYQPSIHQDSAKFGAIGLVVAGSVPESAWPCLAVFQNLAVVSYPRCHFRYITLISFPKYDRVPCKRLNRTSKEFDVHRVLLSEWPPKSDAHNKPSASDGSLRLLWPHLRSYHFLTMEGIFASKSRFTEECEWRMCQLHVCWLKECIGRRNFKCTL